MKKYIYLVFSFFLLIPAIVFMIGCSQVAQDLIDAEMGGIGSTSVFGYFSWPVIFLSDGTLNLANYYSPVTGNRISNATVTVSNETTGLSRIASYDATNRIYTVTEELPHTAGQKVSLKITTTNESITGSSTTTPNPTYSNLSPSSRSSATRPFTVSWDISQGTSEATHTWVIVTGPSTNESQNYQVVVPISQKSVDITSSIIKTGGNNFSITVLGVNSMNLTGAKTGSVVYVGGGNVVYSTGITIEAN